MNPGDVISYLEMCTREGTQLQRGMNFRLGPNHSVVLMSRRPNAPYKDSVLDDGMAVEYEGHDVPKTAGILSPKLLDQPQFTPNGTPTQNGRFLEAARLASTRAADPEQVRVYEKVLTGIWVFNGTFDLVDGWSESDGTRQVFKFRFEMRQWQQSESEVEDGRTETELEHVRVIPSDVKLEVWQRDQGQCVKCGANDNLHFDHVLPYSKGGTSLIAENIQILCARHNLQKSARIE